MKQRILITISLVVAIFTYVQGQNPYDAESLKIRTDYYNANVSRDYMAGQMYYKYYESQLVFHGNSKIDTAYIHNLDCGEVSRETMILKLNGRELKIFKILNPKEGFKATFYDGNLLEIEDLSAEEVGKHARKSSFTDACNDFWNYGYSSKFLKEEVLNGVTYKVVEFTSPAQDTTSSFREKSNYYFNPATGLSDYYYSIDEKGIKTEAFVKKWKNHQGIHQAVEELVTKNGEPYATRFILDMRLALTCNNEAIFTKEYYRNPQNDFGAHQGKE